MNKLAKKYKKQMEEQLVRWGFPEKAAQAFKEVMSQVKRDIKNGTFEGKVERWAKKKKEVK